MATTKKSAVKKPKAKTSSPLTKKPQSKQAPVIEQLRRERDEALEQLAAASHILRGIASSPTDLQPVLNTLAENAALLCGANDALVYRVEGGVMRRVAHYGAVPMAEGMEAREITLGSVNGHAIIEHRTIHVHDLLDERTRERYPENARLQQLVGHRTTLVAPLMREGVALGSIVIRRMEVHPFSEQQIALLETFADQAVIAIENVRLFQELKELLEQQTATSEILGVIASSPTNVQPVLEAVAESAARLCDAEDSVVYRVDGDILQRVAICGSIPIRSTPLPVSRGTTTGRAVVDRQTIHIHDIDAESEADFPDIDKTGIQGGSRARTRLAVPLLREGVALGAILVRRMEVRPFSDKQIKLLETFADQAVIAIENVRLFKEIQERNAELREALEHQTATAEVLSIISRSPTDVQPVLDAIVDSAARVCKIDDVVLRLREGQMIVARAHFGSIPVPASRVEMSIEDPRFRWMRERGTLHIPDRRDQDLIPTVGSVSEWRSWLGVPLRQQGELIGGLFARRIEVRPFTPAQIKLLETFADQAVIAIENVRLFNELKESLEQQTATSEILGAIASSPTDIQPVLDVVVKNAARLCGTPDANIMQVDGDMLRVTAAHSELVRGSPIGFQRPIDRDSGHGRAVLERRIVHIRDFLEVADEFPKSRALETGYRTMLAVPLMRGGVPIGVIGLRHNEVQPFTDKQIALVKTFADQAVIAIENVRLFKEIQERNAELREALQHQTATAEVLSIISRSPTDVQPVLDAIVESAARVCGIDDVVLRLREGENMVARAHLGPMAMRLAEISIDAPEFRWVREHGTLHVPDARAAQNDFPRLGAVSGFRSFLVAPLRLQQQFIGSLSARRTEVRPFTPAQINLLETFADQAVIAIENVRLFQELKESLEQQTATSEILGVIASSPTDIQPVLDVVAENAARLCEASEVNIYRLEGSEYRIVAARGFMPIPRREEARPLIRGLPPAER